MMGTTFLHTCYRVKNLQESVKFYEEVLGFKETRRLDYPEFEFTLVYLSLPGSESYELELTYNYDQKEAYDLGDGYGHIAIGVDSLEETYKEFQQTGYELTDIMGLSDGAAKYFFIKDPDGYKIEVIQK